MGRIKYLQREWTVNTGNNLKLYQSHFCYTFSHRLWIWNKHKQSTQVNMEYFFKACFTNKNKTCTSHVSLFYWGFPCPSKKLTNPPSETHSAFDLKVFPLSPNYGGKKLTSTFLTACRFLKMDQILSCGHAVLASHRAASP